MTRAPRFRVLALAAALAASPLAAQVAAPPPPPPPEPPGWIGVSYETTKAQEGVRVRVVSQVVGVMEGSPAAAAGIRPGDVLVSINGRPWEQLFDKGAPPLRAGDAVRLVVERGGRRQELRVVAGTRPVQHREAGTLKVTMMPDSVVEVLYRAMDSLRVRIVEVEGLRARIAEFQVAADSMMEDLARERVVRLRRTNPGQGVTGTPFAAPTLPQVPGAPSPASPAPFAFWILADSLRDSLRVVGERGAPLFTWSTGEGPAPVIEFRPTVPYVLGENRAAGAEVVELRPELAAYFHVDRGVLVVDVAAGTPAARAGVQPGDVLTHLGGEPLVSIAALRRALTRAAGEVPLTLVRKGRTLQVQLGR
jgi:membrane-associated protease RseP (regulator of RpoE activity)